MLGALPKAFFSYSLPFLTTNSMSKRSEAQRSLQGNRYLFAEMGKRTPRNRPCTLYITNLADYEAFIGFLNKAGFEIRIEDWRYTEHGMLVTFPMRDHAWQLRKFMSGRDIRGDQVSIDKAITQKEGPDTRNPVNAVPTDGAILKALQETYAPTASASQSATSPAASPPQGSDQSERDLEIGDGEGGDDEDDHDSDVIGSKRRRGASEPLPPKSKYKRV